MFLLRAPILALSRSATVRTAAIRLPVTRSVVQRFVAGEATGDAVAAAAALRELGLQVSLDHLGEDTTDRLQADVAVAAYVDLIAALADAGLAEGTEVSLKLSAVGAALSKTAPSNTADGHRGAESLALQGVLRIVRAAYGAGMRVTIDMEDHTTVDATLRTVRALRTDYPDVGVAIQAMLRRSQADLATLVDTGSRVRLVKGAYQEPAEVAYSDKAEVDLAYIRGLRTLMAGSGYPMIASHDPRIIAIADRLATETGRCPGDYEHQMLYGIRPDEQRRLLAAGRTVRVYVPYGIDWYGYFTRRLAERPANLLFFLRALAFRH